jgi:anti-anti-sigma factor
MARVEFIDSTGLSALVAVQNALTKEGKSIELHLVPSSVARIIELVGLTEHLRVRQPETLTD